MTIKLGNNHPDKNRVEAFLRALNLKLEQLPFDWKSLKESRRIEDAVKLASVDRSITITIFFVNGYSDADMIAKSNFVSAAIRWGQNGLFMYVVESADEEKVSEVVGVFAGKE
ncbi:hypothetical protein WBG78_07720 [Chryseolinea sp. T2]|uniref:hypothetical protein n=1 Tax=Chryseolinea sp. T2 TaxID=3129255 RepID=UPI00307885B8